MHPTPNGTVEQNAVIKTDNDDLCHERLDCVNNDASRKQLIAISIGGDEGESCGNDKLKQSTKNWNVSARYDLKRIDNKEKTCLTES